jgi:hypothetical protein
MKPSAIANSKLEGALCIRALGSPGFGGVSSHLGVHRKRCFTPLLRAAHTTRLSRSLLPPPLPAGSAPVTRSAWVTGGWSAGSAPGRVPSPKAGSAAHGWAGAGFLPSPSPAVWRSERSRVSASLTFPASVVSPVSTGRRFWSPLPSMLSADSRFWPVVPRRSLPTPATPNQALQRTAPRVTAAASGPPPSPPAAQLPRRAPQSLSLRSLGDLPRVHP